MTPQHEIAIDAWGAPLPDWIDALAAACAASSQNKIAASLGRSAAVISQALRKKYPGDMAALEETVRGVLMRVTIECPALGTMPVNECQDWRSKARAFSGVNRLRVQMYRACHRCPRNRREVEA